MLEAVQSLRDEMLSFKKASESDVVKTSDSAKAGPSNQPDPIPTLFPGHPTTRMFNQWTFLTFMKPPLPPKSSQNVQSEHASRQSDVESDHSEHQSESEHT